jgi:nucleoside-diphosphate-sugar epimerase
MDTPDERFLVTGALGCIGAWTIKVLLARGIYVVGTDLATDDRRLRAIAPPGDLARLTVEKADISNLTEVTDVIQRNAITRVIHLAALQIPFCKDNPPLGALVNVVGTVNVFEAAKRSGGQVRSIAYMSSIGMYDAADVVAGTQRLGEAAVAHPPTHYGVYKQANEGSASVYWREDGVCSVGLRPFIVYGPGRDQGLTSAPTLAMQAAARGETFHIPYGGTAVYQFAEDVAATTIAACLKTTESARVFNLPGVTAQMQEIVDAIEAAEPRARGRITFDEKPLPLPPDVEAAGILDLLSDVPCSLLADATARTVEHFRLHR